MAFELGQLLIAIFSGTIVSGATLFRWGLLTQKLKSDLNDKIETVYVDLKEQNKATLHTLAILKKDLAHDGEICQIQMKNELILLQGNLKLIESRVLSIEKYLAKTNGFKIRAFEEEKE